LFEDNDQNSKTNKELVFDKYNAEQSSRSNVSGGAWLAQSVECETLDLRVVSSSPTLGAEII